MINQVLKSSSLGIIAKILQGVGSFLLIRILILQLGQDEYGKWMTVSSSISLVSFLDFGMGNSLVNKLAEYNASGDRVNIAKTSSLCIFLLASIILVILICFLLTYSFIKWNLFFNLTSEYRFLIFITFLLFVLNILTNTIYSIQRGLQRSDTANLWLLYGSLLYLIAIISFLNYYPSLILTAYISFGLPILISILNFYLFNRKYQLIDFSYFNLKYIKESLVLFRDGLVFLYLQIASIIAFQADTLILAHFANFKAVSQYNVVAKLFSIPTIFISVYYQSLWPSYTHNKVIGNWNWIKKTYYKSILFSFILVLIYSLLIIMFKKLILLYWLKDQIEIDNSLFILFAIWTIVNLAIATNIGTLLNSLNIVKLQIISSIFMLILNVILSIYFTIEYGVIGVLIGSIISSTIFSCVPLLIYIKLIFNKKLNINA
jgi:O-antigen/teichoic acid export membrane protein